MRNFFLLLFHLCFEKKFRKPKPFFSFSEKEKNKNKNYENSRVKDAKIAKKKRKHYANENTNCHTSHLHACRVFGRWLAHMWLAQTHTKCIENKNDAKPRTDMSLYLHLFYFIFFLRTTCKWTKHIKYVCMKLRHERQTNVVCCLTLWIIHIHFMMWKDALLYLSLFMNKQIFGMINVVILRQFLKQKQKRA